MTPDQQTSGFDLVLALVAGLLLLALFFGSGRVLEFIPMRKTRREAVERALPVVGTLVGLSYLLLLARTTFRDHADYVPLALTVVLVAFAAASWFAVRDIITGVVLKAGRVCRVGDHVRVEGVAGRIKRMGVRVLAIETNRGDEAIIPYARIARESVLRTPVTDNVAPHVFRIPAPADLPVSGAKTVIRETALRSHWAALVREPEITLVDDNTFEVTVFALDADHGPDIEAAVRRTRTFDRRSTPRPEEPEDPRS